MSVPARTVADLSSLLTRTGRVPAIRMAAAFTETGAAPRAYRVLLHALEAERPQVELAGIADLDKTTVVAAVDWRRRGSPNAACRAGTGGRGPSASPPRRSGGSPLGLGIADRVRREVLDALPEEQREVFLSALTRPAEGHLATPAESPRPVRRSRRRRNQ